MFLHAFLKFSQELHHWFGDPAVLRADVPLLAVHFLQRYAEEIGKPAGGFTQQAMELMMGYNWPGNVRELQN